MQIHMWKSFQFVKISAGWYFNDFSVGGENNVRKENNTLIFK